MQLKLTLLLAIQALLVTSENSKRSRYYSGPIRSASMQVSSYYGGPDLISYTPPPGYGQGNPPSKGMKSHVSHPVGAREPPNLDYDDIINLVNNLNKHDLDRIIEFAKSRDQNTHPNDESETNEDSSENVKTKPKIPFYSDHKEEEKPDNKHHNIPPREHEINQYRTIYTSPKNAYLPPRYHANEKPHKSEDLQLEENHFNSYLRNPNHHDENKTTKKPKETHRPVENYNQNYYQHPYFTLLHPQNKSVTPDQSLKPPMEDMKEVKQVVQMIVGDLPEKEKVPGPLYPVYDVKSFGSLPLMEYHSKLDSVSSYYVPHYSITNLNSTQSTTTQAAPTTTTIKPKTIKNEDKPSTDIWINRSIGQYYRWNPDGTISMDEQSPAPPEQPFYGYY